jgi:WD40 repeat protein
MLVFQGPKHDVQCLAFVPGKDGHSIAAGYWGHLYIWPISGGEPASFSVGPDEQLFGTSGLEELAVSPDGKLIVGNWYRGLHTWQYRRRKWTATGLNKGWGLTAGITFRGKELIVISWGETPTHWWNYKVFRGCLDSQCRYQPGEPLKTEGHPEAVTLGSGRAELSPAGDVLATAANEKAVQLWNARSGKHRASLPQRGFVEALAWSPDGATLAINAGVTVRLYDVATLTERIAWKVKYANRPRMTFSPDGRLLATTDASAGVHLWDADSGRLTTTLKAGRTRRVPIAFAPDALTLAAGGMDGSVVVWDL